MANDKKGLAGEQYVDTLLEKLSFDHYSLKGLSLTWNGSKFQLDNSIISQQILYNLEVKNLEGDYYIEDDKWYSLDSGKSRTNHLNQLDRADTLLRQMVNYYQLNLQVKSLLLFPNPQFTLFQASKDLPIILPTQLNKFIDKLNTVPSTLNQQHRWLADKMIALHKEEAPYQYISTPYQFELLKKGVVCKCCRLLLIETVRGRTFYCSACKHKESVDEGIIRMVKEFRLLFPERRVETPVIFDWCGRVISMKTIWRVLNTNYIQIRKGNKSHYIEKSEISLINL
ncbi:nuclease-related domain-containing protein [Evansella sp. AB-rgal1]|uniref:nuclease-related domain-containing protein n=1 Tax=Evansella sp. AB-rgal1 TaxID=3242696 RepID=UPI00359D8A04